MASPRGRTKSAEEKTTEAARHAAIRAKAIEATALLGTQSPDGAIDIEKLADLLGAEIVYGDLDGAKARVVQIGARARIIISKKIVGVGAIRFCIAHEIGHLLLKHYAHGDTLGRAFKRQRTCSPMTSDGSEIERDACVFATECLMPAPLAGPMCQVAPVSFDPVRAIASAFATSLQASAMRFVEPLPTYFDDGRLEASRVLPATTWFPRETHARDASVYEHMTAIPEQAAAFSLLWLPTT
jgi:hypothetical protein